jgi:two-component system response regulator YesN
MTKVLIVDDEPWIVALIRGLVQWDSLGMSVVGDAGDGAAAMAMVVRLRPDVLITDIRMPHMDGLELIEHARLALPLLRVIIISGYDDFVYARRALQLRAVDYLLKPVNALDLTQALAACRLPPAPETTPAPFPGAGSRLRHPRVRRALDYIATRYAGNLSLTEVAEAVDAGVTYFSELFKKEVGVGFAEYLTTLRIEAAKRLLSEGLLKVREVAARVGYRNANYFSRVFRKYTGVKATEYERRGPPQAGGA